MEAKILLLNLGFVTAMGAGIVSNIDSWKSLVLFLIAAAYGILRVIGKHISNKGDKLDNRKKELDNMLKERKLEDMEDD